MGKRLTPSELKLLVNSQQLIRISYHEQPIAHLIRSPGDLCLEIHGRFCRQRGDFKRGQPPIDRAGTNEVAQYGQLRVELGRSDFGFGIGD